MTKRRLLLRGSLCQFCKGRLDMRVGMGKEPHSDQRCRFWGFGIVSFLASFAWSLNGFAKPFIPGSDDEVLERLPVSTGSVNNELTDLRAAVGAASGNLELAVKLAQIYIKLGQAESDPRYYGYAQGVLSPWWGEQEPPSRVRLLRAYIRQNRHDFDGALKDLEQVLQIEPGNNQAWLTRAVILKVRARYDEARVSCLLLAQAKNPLLAMTCLAEVNSLTGRARESYDFLREALQRYKELSQDQRFWSLTTLAEMAVRIDRNEEADGFFKEALAIRPQSAYLLAAYADFLLDQRRPAEAVALLADKSRIDTLLVRLALAKQQIKADDLPEVTSKIEEQFAASRFRNENFHQGDEARFTLYILGQPQEAVRLAAANWRMQREPQDARILLEAAIAAHDRAAAQPVLELLAKTGMEHVQLKRLAAELDKLP